MADARHKRDADARRRPQAITVAAGLALSVTAGAVVLGVAVAHPAHNKQDAVALDVPTSTMSADSLERAATLSRGGARTALPSASGSASASAKSTKAAKKRPLGPALPALHRTTEWTTDALNLWPSATEKDHFAGVLDSGTKVTALGPKVDGREEILVEGKPWWVTTGYLTTDKPVTTASTGSTGTAATPAAGLSDAPCPDSSVEKGLAADTIRLYRAVCHAFPQVTHYLGWGPREEHDTGHAIDVMVYRDKALGDQVAAWAQAHAAELNLYDVIWYDRIWTPVRSAEGWRDYGDHGSPTANHMDHVHIGTN